MAEESQRLLQTTGVKHRYNQQLELSFPDLSIAKGDALLILGESGVGKTTLLHILAGILKPSTGRVTFLEEDIYQLKDTKRDKLRGKEIGLVFQVPHFMESLSVMENLALATKISGAQFDDSTAGLLLDKLGIKEKAGAPVYTLSQGQMQRLSIARALLKKPALILADEPTSALDDTSARNAIGLMKELVSAVGSGLMIVTHDNRIKSEFKQVVTLDKSEVSNQ